MSGEKRGPSRVRGGLLKRLIAALCLGVSCLVLTMPSARADGGDETNDEPLEDAGAARSGEEQGGNLEVRKSDRGVLTIEGLLLRRKDLTDVPFTKQGETGTSFARFDSSELNSNEFTAGVRATLKAEFFDQPVEISGFYLDPIGQEIRKFGFGAAAAAFDTDAVYEGVPGTDIPVLTGSDNIDGMAVSHQTRLYGAEANLLRPFGLPGFLIGVRGISFGEDFNATAIDEGSIPPAGLTRDHVSIRSDNRLLGIQVGLAHMFDLGDSVRVGGSVKAGLFNNFIDQRRTFVSELRDDLRSYDRSLSGDVFAQGIEFNPRVELKLAEGVLLSATGHFLWLNNVSEAVTHYASSADLDDRNLRADGDTYFYGGSLGLTFLLENTFADERGLTPVSSAAEPASMTEVEERIAALEETSARKGNEKLTLDVSGSINRMLMAWDDGEEQDVYIVDNTSARSRLEFRGGAKIARGWSAGYFLSVGLDDTAANDVSQLDDNGEGKLDLRHSAWWLRSNLLGTVHVGLTSPATDDIILKDVGGIMPGAANIATMGGNLFMRRADRPELSGEETLVLRGAFTTTLDEFAAGGSVDTLRRNVVRYDAPRLSTQFGNFNAAVAWGENDFVDASIEHSLSYNDWKWRFGAGWLNDRDIGTGPGRRDREEWKGSASLLHMPSGLFGTVAYVHRTFSGESTSQQTTFGENTVGIAGPVTNRPATDYLYSAFGVRRAFSEIGDTSLYGEYGQVDDSLTGMREAALREVTDSRMQMVGAAISQNIDAAALDVYLGVRHFRFDTEGVTCRVNVNPCTSAASFASPIPLNDITIGYAGTRIKF